MEKLEPCPFCNSERIGATINTLFSNQYYAHCIDCWAQGPLCRTQKEAIKKWNTRKGGK